MNHLSSKKQKVEEIIMNMFYDGMIPCIIFGQKLARNILGNSLHALILTIKLFQGTTALTFKMLPTMSKPNFQ